MINNLQYQCVSSVILSPKRSIRVGKSLKLRGLGWEGRRPHATEHLAQFPEKLVIQHRFPAKAEPVSRARCICESEVFYPSTKFEHGTSESMGGTYVA